MSNELMNVYCRYGCPDGDDLGIFEVAEWGAERIKELEAELAKAHEYGYQYRQERNRAQAELAALKAQAVIPEKARDALAWRCLWIAYVWNDHNFLGAYKYAREEAESHGITSFDEATEWLEAQPQSDAGIVDMYRHLQKVTPYRFKKIQDASITDGGDVMYFHKDRFDAALLADMAELVAALIEAQKIINHQGWSASEQAAYDTVAEAIAKHRGDKC